MNDQQTIDDFLHRNPLSLHVGAPVERRFEHPAHPIYPVTLMPTNTAMDSVENVYPSDWVDAAAMIETVSLPPYRAPTTFIETLSSLFGREAYTLQKKGFLPIEQLIEELPRYAHGELSVHLTKETVDDAGEEEDALLVDTSSSFDEKFHTIPILPAMENGRLRVERNTLSPYPYLNGLLKNHAIPLGDVGFGDEAITFTPNSHLFYADFTGKGERVRQTTAGVTIWRGEHLYDVCLMLNLVEK